MSPNFSITNRINEDIIEITRLLNEIKENFSSDKNPVLRRKNRIKTIHGSYGWSSS